MFVFTFVLESVLKLDPAGSSKYFLTMFSLCFLLATAPAEPATIRVPGDFQVIQEALDAAKDGDLVVVAEGSYSGEGNMNLDFSGKRIRLRSESGSESTVIDCGFLGPGVRFHTGEDYRTSINGFTIRNGSAGYGAGISLEGASPRITDCRFTGCVAEHDGGGLDCRAGSDPLITRCRASGNEAGFGGGIACYRSDPVIDRCLFEDNTAHSFGGGIYLYYSESLVSSCVVKGNSASSGAGIRCSAYGSPLILNCTVIDNEASVSGGGVHGSSASAVFTAANSIIWSNSPDEIVDFSGSSQVTFCDVSGGWPGEGNIDEDPLFIPPGGYHLGDGSPCAEAGGALFAQLDADGDIRPRGSKPDIGADERDDGGLEVLLEGFPSIIIRGMSYTVGAVIGNTDVEPEAFDSAELKAAGPDPHRLVLEPGEPVFLEPGEEIEADLSFVLPETAVRPGFYSFTLLLSGDGLLEARDRRFAEVR